MISKIIFKDFSEYWYYVKNLDKEQRDTIFNSLPSNEQKKLQSLYNDEGWEDLFMRNTLDKISDDLRDNYNVNLLNIRINALKGKSQILDKSKWLFIMDLLKDFDEKHTNYILGGLDIEALDDSCIIIKKKK